MKLRCKNTIKNNRIDRERGSSSVLVIMVMLLLITFGVLAMMSSYSNLKIANKNAEWTKDFYALESIAELDLVTFEMLFKEAQSQTSELLKNDTIDLISIESLPDSVQKEILQAYQSLPIGDKVKLNAFHNQLFLYFLYDGLVKSAINEKNMTCNFDETILSGDSNNEWIPEVTFISNDTETKRNLFVKIAFDASQNTVAQNGYEIVEWREVPDNFEYDNMLEFEDPEGN